MAKKQTDKNLSAREELFCYEYVKDLNARMAAIRAGYKLPNYHAATRISSKPEIKAFIAKLIDERKKACKISAERILENLAAVAFSDINNVLSVEQEEIIETSYGKNGKGPEKKEKVVVDRVKFRPWHTQDTRAIQSIKQSDNGSISVKMGDATKNRELLMKATGMLKDITLDGLHGFVQAFTKAEAEYKAAEESKKPAEAAPGGKQ